MATITQNIHRDSTVMKHDIRAKLDMRHRLLLQTSNRFSTCEWARGKRRTRKNNSAAPQPTGQGV
jgi:hypothetical protein